MRPKVGINVAKKKSISLFKTFWDICMCERFLFNSITQFLSVNTVVLMHPKVGQAMSLGVKAAQLVWGYLTKPLKFAAIHFSESITRKKVRAHTDLHTVVFFAASVMAVDSKHADEEWEAVTEHRTVCVRIIAAKKICLHKTVKKCKKLMIHAVWKFVY